MELPGPECDNFFKKLIISNKQNNSQCHPIVDKVDRKVHHYQRRIVPNNGKVVMPF